MSALLALKSVLLVEAIAGEAGQLAPTKQAQNINPPAAPAHDQDRAPAGQQLPAGDAAPTIQPSGRDRTQAQAAPLSDAERGILLDLRHRRQALEARARDLDMREAELAAADSRLADRVQQLASLQSRLETLETSRQQHSTENWVGLVKIYEAMKARDAAAIFDVLDMQVLLQVLDRMQERRAAAVLSAMQPDRARLATQMLAELRTRAVTPAAAAAAAAAPPKS